MNVLAKSESKEFEPNNATLLVGRESMTCGIDLSEDLFTGISSEIGDGPSSSEIRADFSPPFQDWYDLALQVEPVVKPVRSSWGDDDEEGDEELPTDDGEEEEQDPFEDFDEDDFDDDFDDDFEEELEDEYEIEPADDGMVTDLEDGDIDPDLVGDEGEEPDLDEDVE